MENTKENTDLNMGRAKNDRWKKILGIILNIALLLLIDGLLVYTFINEGNRIYKGTIIKILLIVTGNILFLVLLFWGEKICSAIKNTTFLKIADVILLLATPGIVFMLVQMVTWVSGYKNKAVSTFKGLVKMSLLMEQPYLTLNLIIYAIFFIILIILFRKINIASSALCYLFIILAMVNYYVMEFRGEPFQLLDIVGMGTAAEVVGEYSFKIKLMLGIPLIYALVFGEFVLKFQKLELGKKSRKNTAARFRKAIEMLKLTGIPNPENCFKQYPYELSGGMQQRVMIAMALSCEPKLLIADEPTTALDVTIQEQILQLIRELNEKLGMSVLFITHDMGAVANLCHNVKVMYLGQVVEEASTEELFQNPLHSYTQGLLSCIPHLGVKKGEPLPVIEGSVPPLSKVPVGCHFCTRCKMAGQHCMEHEPPACEVAPGHVVKCWKYAESGKQEV